MTIPYAHMADVAAAAGVGYCRGIDPNGFWCGDIRTSHLEHQRGFVRDDVVHFSDRRVSRSAIRQFAMLAAEIIIDQPMDDMPAWRSRWLRCSIAEEICRKKLHVRIPSAYWNLDRMTVRAQLIHVEPDVPQRKEAVAWTRLAG
jgi:hypothetical protein